MDCRSRNGADAGGEGKQDRLIPLAHGERYASRIPGARLEVIDKCGHLPMIEQPDKVQELVTSFLR